MKGVPQTAAAKAPATPLAHSNAAPPQVHSTSATPQARPSTVPQADAKGTLLHIFHADANNNVALICPACKSKRVLDGEKLRGVKQPATMKCKCGNVFQCRFQLTPPKTKETPPGVATAQAAPVPSNSSTVAPAGGGSPSSPTAPRPLAPPTPTPQEDFPVFTADRHNRFTVICPACKDARTIEGDKIKGVKQPATMKCKCGQVFKCRFKPYEPEFPEESPASNIEPPEKLDLPQFTQISETQRFSQEAKDAASANRKALLTFRNIFDSDTLDEEDQDDMPVDATAMLRDEPPRQEEDRVPLSADAAEHVSFQQPASHAQQSPRAAPASSSPTHPVPASPMQTALPVPVAPIAPATAPEEGVEQEQEHKRALAVLRLANLEKKRAREAMEQAETERQRALSEIQLAAQEHKSAVTADQQELERRRAEAMYHQAYLETQRAQAALQHAEVKRMEAEFEAQRRSFERERQELTTMRMVLEQERKQLMQQKMELERILRLVANTPQSSGVPTAAAPATLPVFTPDAEGIIKVVCPNCSKEKALPAEMLKGVKQPARMKCNSCQTVFHCRFNLAPNPLQALSSMLEGMDFSASPSDLIPTFYADLQGNVTIVCPKCHTGKLLSKEDVRGAKQPALIKCSACSHMFSCRFFLGDAPTYAKDFKSGASRITHADEQLEPVETMAGLDDDDMSAMSMQSDELGQFVQKLYSNEPSPNESPAGRIHTHRQASPSPTPPSQPQSREEENLATTMEAERLQSLFAERDDEDIAAAAVSLMGDDLSDFFNQKEFQDAGTSASGENDEDVLEVSPDEVEVLPVEEELAVAEVLPALPFESAHSDAPNLPIYYVDEKKQVMVLCPKCERGRNLDLSSHPDVGPIIRTWCKCGNEYLCRLEFRRSYRKEVELPGSYFNPSSGQRGDIMVVDLSLGGVGFTANGPHSLKRENVVDITFQLDDLKMTHIHRRVRICNVKGDFLGSEFLEHRERDKELGYYLMP